MANSSNKKARWHNKCISHPRKSWTHPFYHQIGLQVENLQHIFIVEKIG